MRSFSLGDERGFSLLELTIGISLLLGLLSGIYAFQMVTAKSWNTSTQLIDSRSEGQRAMGVVEGNLREAHAVSEVTPALEYAHSNDLVFYADIDNDDQPERVRFYVTGRQLVTEVQQSLGTDPITFSAAITSRVLTDSLSNTTGQPVFRYYSSPAQELSVLPLDPANRSKVRLIAVTLAVDKKPAELPGPVVLEANVNLRNVK